MNISSREVQQVVEEFLCTFQFGTVKGINKMHPEYSPTSIRYALMFLEKMGKARQEGEMSGNAVWILTNEK